ncbi:MAG: hypothetical protein CMJ65_05225 [Planctomycetaceae bacterium]|nr:hypothetical protein [Planctomycetaceae bacterium]
MCAVIRSTLFGVLVLLSVCIVTKAEPVVDDAKAAAPGKAAAESATPEKIREWIDALTSRDFEVRRDASRKLLTAGQLVVKAVATAADGKDLERTTRCIALLRKMLASMNKATKSAAESALKQLTKSRSRGVARRAAAALPKPDPSPGRGAVSRNTTRMSVRVRNGRRTINVTSGGRNIIIEDVNGKEISVRVTDTVKGQAKTRETKAADAADLKKKDPEAHKLYEQYAVKNRVLIRQGGRAGVQNRFPRLIPRIGRAGGRALSLPRGSPWHQQVERAYKQVEEAVTRLEQLAKQPKASPAELRDVLKRLTTARKTLAELLGAAGRPAGKTKKAAPRVPAAKPKPVSRPRATDV